MKEQVQEILIAELHPFRNHPFYVKDDESMQALCDSIREYGVLSPLLARPTGEGYEIVSGHRRRSAAIKLGFKKLPVLVREMSDDEAIILMVDSNIQRENLLPSEKAFAYKMKFNALKHQGQRTSGQFVPNSDSNRTMAKIGEEKGESYKTVQRYIRLTNLAKPILDLVDEGRIAFSPGVELSYDRLIIIPESADNKDITHIRFRDAAYLCNGFPRAFSNGRNLDQQIAQKKNNGSTVYEFDLCISVDKLENVLMEIAEYLIDFAP